jgi:hypothetical protein
MVNRERYGRSLLGWSERWRCGSGTAKPFDGWVNGRHDVDEAARGGDDILCISEPVDRGRGGGGVWGCNPQKSKRWRNILV